MPLEAPWHCPHFCWRIPGASAAAKAEILIAAASSVAFIMIRLSVVILCQANRHARWYKSFMPLPTDEKLLKLSNDLIAQLDAIFGEHPGFRPAHAKGGHAARFIITPSAEGAALTRAPHLHRTATPVTVRFSNSTGLPQMPDADPSANPRGMAIRFHLDEHVHTDIVGHSTDGFPVRTGDEFLEFLRAVAVRRSKENRAVAIGGFLRDASERFGVRAGAEAFTCESGDGGVLWVTAMRFISEGGAARYGRYRIVPEAGVLAFG